MTLHDQDAKSKRQTKCKQENLWSHKDQRSQWSQWSQQCPEDAGQKKLYPRQLSIGLNDLNSVEHRCCYPR